MTTYERLTLAIDRLNTWGWKRHGRGHIGKPVCLLGALGATRDEAGMLTLHSVALPEIVELTREIDTAAKVMGFADWCDIPNWNDFCADKPAVLHRLETARDKILHEEANKGSTDVRELEPQPALA